MSTEDRVTDLERSFAILTRLLESASERADTHESWINQLGTAQAETETKLAALVDAQIRTDDKIALLAAAQTRSDDKITALASAQMQTEAALQQLIAQQARTDAQLAQLIARVDKLTDALERHAGDAHAHEV